MSAKSKAYRERLIESVRHMLKGGPAPDAATLQELLAFLENYENAVEVFHEIAVVESAATEAVEEPEPPTTRRGRKK